MIKAGDMVQLVWGCCAAVRVKIGWTGIVMGIESADMLCPHCGYKVVGEIALLDFEHRSDCGVPPSWLIKVPPKAKGQTETTEEELTA